MTSLLTHLSKLDAPDRIDPMRRAELSKIAKQTADEAGRCFVTRCPPSCAQRRPARETFADD